ncbi:MAG TPA: phage major capsid protein [Verrucomicrobiae bacterium]
MKLHLKQDPAEGGEMVMEALDTIEKGVEQHGKDIAELKKNSAETILADQSRWPAELKRLAEDLTKAKDALNGHDTETKNFQRKMKEIETLLRNEVRSQFGSPIKRISGNEELRTRFNCAIRLAMDNKGDMQKLCEAQLKAIGEDTTPGSTLINTALFREIYDTLAQYGTWNTLGVRRLGTKLTRFPVKTARPAAQWILTEGGTINDDTNKAGSEVTCEVEVLAVLLNISLQLLQDSEFDVTADVLDDFAEAYAYALDYTCYQGNGAADGTNGGMTGLFNFGTAAIAAAGNTTIGQLQLDDFVAARNTLDVGVLSRPLRCWIHPYNLTKIALIRDKQGRSIFQTMLEVPSPTVGSILGAPVVPAAAAPSTDAPGAQVLTIGDPNGYVVGMREDFSFEASDHFRWNALQRSFRGYGRAGAKGRKSGAFAVLTLPQA